MGRAHPPAETWRKVGVTDGQRLVLLHKPLGWDVGEVPSGVRTTTRRGATPADVMVAFYGSLSALRREVPTLAGSITPSGAVWIAWPRKAAGRESDLGDTVVRETLLATSVLVDVKVAALDEDWSGLKFVWRLAERPR